MNRYLKLYMESVRKNGAPPFTDADKCSEAEIQAVEEAQSIQIPASIRETLLMFGNRLPQLNAPLGRPADLYLMKEAAMFLLGDGDANGNRLPENSFVFHMASPEEFRFLVVDSTKSDFETFYFYVDYEVISKQLTFWEHMMDSV